MSVVKNGCVFLLATSYGLPTFHLQFSSINRGLKYCKRNTASKVQKSAENISLSTHTHPPPHCIPYLPFPTRSVFRQAKIDSICWVTAFRLPALCLWGHIVQYSQAKSSKTLPRWRGQNFAELFSLGN